jgi:hypothetical protein
MANKKDLKAFVRYDGTGRVIAGSLILQRFKPKDGNWQQTQAYECCDPFIESRNFLLLENSTPNDQNMLLQEDGGRIIL